MVLARLTEVSRRGSEALRARTSPPGLCAPRVGRLKPADPGPARTPALPGVAQPLHAAFPAEDLDGLEEAGADGAAGDGGADGVDDVAALDAEVLDGAPHGRLDGFEVPVRQRLEAVAARHEVQWRWVKGHAGHPENERADQLATGAIAMLSRPSQRS